MGVRVGGEIELDGALVIVAGLGVSGRAAAEVLASRGARVVPVDDHADDVIGTDELLAGTALDRASLVVASPGLAPHHPLLAAALDRGLPVWSEVELAWRVRVDRASGGGPAPWLAVTGTNGKTTTVGMLESILRAAGKSVAAVGNVGTPVVLAAVDPAVDVLVVELSSFQLHFTHSMSAQAAAVLNVAADHLDWHGSLEAYAADKGRIYERAQVACVYNLADRAHRGPRARGRRGRRRGRRRVHARHAPGRAGRAGRGRAGGPRVRAPAAHPRRRARAPSTTWRTWPDPTGPCRRTSSPTPWPPVRSPSRTGSSRPPCGPGCARTPRVRTAWRPSRRSTASRTSTTRRRRTRTPPAAALGAFAPGSVVWVAGGLAKGARFDELVASRKDRLAGVVLIGVDREPLREALARHAPEVPVVEVDAGETEPVMTRAVHEARRLAVGAAGPITVLLAPACASMDQFTSYAARGEEFAAAVRALGEDV